MKRETENRAPRSRNGVRWTALAALALIALVGASQTFADNPDKETYFICPSVSTHNVNGTWVIGTHGGYYVLVPTKGGANDNSKVYLRVPVSVPSLAQIPAGWALYNDLPSYPDFEGTAMLLSEGISAWLGSPAGWQEGDMASVVSNGNGYYTVTNMRLNEQVEINSSIPLASAAAW